MSVAKDLKRVLSSGYFLEVDDDGNFALFEQYEGNCVIKEKAWYKFCKSLEIFVDGLDAISESDHAGSATHLTAVGE